MPASRTEHRTPRAKRPSRMQPPTHGDNPWTEQTMRELDPEPTVATEETLETNPPTDSAPEVIPDDGATIRGESPSFSLPCLLQFLGTNRKAGTLHIETPSRGVTTKYELRLQEGRIIHATCHPRPMEEQLGSILLSRDLLEADLLGELIEHCRLRDKRLGELLHERGLVLEEDLRNALEYQVELMFFRLFATENACFRFYENELEQPKVQVNMGVMELLLESARISDEGR